jgi:hypothetical protein
MNYINEYIVRNKTKCKYYINDLQNLWNLDHYNLEYFGYLKQLFSPKRYI